MSRLPSWRHDRVRCRMLVLSLALPALLPAQEVRVIDDQRAEVIGILFRIAGAPDFGNATLQPYTRRTLASLAFCLTRQQVGWRGK